MQGLIAHPALGHRWPAQHIATDRAASPYFKAKESNRTPALLCTWAVCVHEVGDLSADDVGQRTMKCNLNLQGSIESLPSSRVHVGWCDMSLAGNMALVTTCSRDQTPYRRVGAVLARVDFRGSGRTCLHHHTPRYDPTAKGFILWVGRIVPFRCPTCSEFHHEPVEVANLMSSSLVRPAGKDLNRKRGGVSNI